jgi:hypothetical protein
VSVLTLALLTCLSIDFSNPLLPGVVRFDDRESVYAVRAERPRTDERNAVTALLPPPGSRPPALDGAPPRAVLAAVEPARPAPAAVRPRSMAATARVVPAPVAGDDH